VYALGLLGHAIVGVATRPYFAAGRPAWYPAVAVGAGVAVNAVLAALTVARFGVTGIAAANGIGIALAAALLLAGLRRRDVGVAPGPVAATVGRVAVAAGGAGLAGWFAARLLDGLGPVAVSVVGGVVVLGGYAVLLKLVRYAR
jgi:putative peptidoglycan lipid II flippase